MALFKAPHQPLNRAHWALAFHRHAGHAVSVPTLGKAQRRNVWRSRCPSSRGDEAGLESADLSKGPNGGEADLTGEELSVRAGSQGGSSAASSEQDPSGVLRQQQGVQEVLRFAVPALGMVLAEPLMSLIDTACVGQVSSLQLAALGPNTAIFNFAFQLFAFLGVATTSIIASNSPNLPSLDAEAKAARLRTAQETLSNSLCLAVLCGTLVMVSLLWRGGFFLRAMGAGAEYMAPALQYLTIRALAGPAVLLMSVSQGACLGQQDTWTPFTVLLAAGLLNAVGDIYLIRGRGLGVAGAAAATAAAQYLGAAYFLYHMWRKGRQKGGIPLKFTGMPCWDTVRPFLSVAVTVLGKYIVGMASYFVITTSATKLGTLSTATHQVAMQVFWFLAYFPEPLSLAAQSLIARDRYEPQQARRWAWLLLSAGSALGWVLAAVLAGIFTRGTWIFTQDAAVQQTIAALTPIGVLATIICSSMMMFDGISIGSGNFQHVPLGNAVGLLITLSVLWASRRWGLGLPGVWWALVTFYATRLLVHLVHYSARGRNSVFWGGSSAGSQPAAVAA